MARELILKLGKKITDRVDVKLGMTQLDETSPEYYGLASVVTDEMAELALAMKVRVPTTPAEIGKKVGKDLVYVEQLFDQMSMIGLLEYNWENADHHKQWTLPIFVPGSAELMNMNLQQVEEHPEIAQFFERMAFLPLTKITCMVPPGGAGVGMHVIPVEKAIPATNESVDVEHISHWLKKYDGHIGVGYCSCRNAMRLQGQGCGELQDEMCIAVGQFCDYCLETGKGRKITYEEAMEILQRAEDNGYVHQITNIDGEDKIFAICNCALGSCFALRTSQLFNTPNMSASAYRAHVDAEKCVACGKCAEVCPAGAAKLGQKLCTKTGPVVYPQQPLPDDNHWGEHMWSPNYKDDNQKQCHESGTAPCKTACPAHIAVQGYINLAAQGRYLDALKLIKQDNPFPAVCGSICNRRCEDACTRGNVDRAVAIDEIKKFVAEQELQADKRYIPKVITHRGIADTVPGEDRHHRRRPGRPVRVPTIWRTWATKTSPCFDKNEVPGGMLTLGIPSFRLEKDVVNAEIEVLKEMGVHFQCGVEIGKDITIDQLREQGYKGFYLAIGAQKSAPHWHARRRALRRVRRRGLPAQGQPRQEAAHRQEVRRHRRRQRCHGRLPHGYPPRRAGHLRHLPPQSGRDAGGRGGSRRGHGRGRAVPLPRALRPRSSARTARSRPSRSRSWSWASPTRRAAASPSAPASSRPSRSRPSSAPSARRVDLGHIAPEGDGLQHATAPSSVDGVTLSDRAARRLCRRRRGHRPEVRHRRDRGRPRGRCVPAPLRA